MLVSYGRLSPLFQFSLSAGTLVYLSQWCESSLNFFLWEKGVRLGLVVEGEGGRLGLVLVVICLRLDIPFSSGVPS